MYYLAVFSRHTLHQNIFLLSSLLTREDTLTTSCLDSCDPIATVSPSPFGAKIVIFSQSSLCSPSRTKKSPDLGLVVQDAGVHAKCLPIPRCPPAICTEMRVTEKRATHRRHLLQKLFLEQLTTGYAFLFKITLTNSRPACFSFLLNSP